MYDFSHYEVIEIKSNYTDEEISSIRERDYKFCLETLKTFNNKTDDELKIIWMLLTSRGDNKLIYGPMPDLKDN